MATETMITKSNNNGTAQWAVEVDGNILCSFRVSISVWRKRRELFYGRTIHNCCWCARFRYFLYGIGLLYDLFKGKVNTRRCR